MTDVVDRPGRSTESVDLTGYTATDTFFGEPFIDIDEQWEQPVPHRMIHGGFTGTATRFRFHFPPKDIYQGRMLSALAGGTAGSEDSFSGDNWWSIGMNLLSVVRLGGYLVQTNQGHAGDALDEVAGDDPTIYGFRASNEAARLSKYVAEQIYGEAPHHSYVFGASGGSQRSANCFENGEDVWDGAMPFVGGASVAAPEDPDPQVSGAYVTNTMLNCKRLLGDKLEAVIDAMAPGGSGNPFEGLSSAQREELATLYRLGFPRGDETIIGLPGGINLLWASHGDLLYEQERDYFEAFWSQPGYAGHDQPEVVGVDRINKIVKVSRILTTQQMAADPVYSGQEYRVLRGFSNFGGGMALELDPVGPGYRLGARLTVKTGAAAGRSVYCVAHKDEFVVGSGGFHGGQGIKEIAVGDEVEIDNSRYLAYLYYPRHHVEANNLFDAYRINGAPIYPQHKLSHQSPLMGVCNTGSFKGKLLWVQNMHDYSCWPSLAVHYRDGVLRAQGERGAAERFRLRFTEHAEHSAPWSLPTTGPRAPSTWLIDHGPVMEQCLQDLIDWVERDIELSPTAFTLKDGHVILPEAAAQRGGIQPVVSLTANGSARADVAVGQSVRIELHAEVPPGAGTVVSVNWDYDGSGEFAGPPSVVDGSQESVDFVVTHTYDTPGTYFVTARVESHRQGDVEIAARRIPNLAQARVVVS